MTRRWYEFRAQAKGAEIVIYDEIGAFGIPAKAFLDELKALGPVTELTVRINSPGGSVFDGIAIYNALKRHDAAITVWIDGIAASIASMMAMAGDEVVMPENAMLMLHDPSGLVMGTAGDMRAMAEALDKMKAGTILADEVQNVRAFGSENMLEGVQAVVSQRLTEMATKMDATLEHLRVGAIKGQILDADGTAVIYDLFTEFGVTAHTEIDFDLDNASPAPGAVKKKCHDIRRKIEDELGVVPYDHIHAMCGARLLRRPDHPFRGREGVRPLAGRRVSAPGPGARLVRVRRHPVRGISRTGGLGRLHRCCQGVLLPGRGARAVPAVQCARRLRRDRQHHRPAALRQAGGGPAVRPLGHAARAVQPAADLHPAARADQGQAHLMTVFQGAVDATFVAFGIDAVYTPAGGEPVPVRVIARRPDTIVGFGETRIHTETATFEVRASEVASPRPGDQFPVGGDTFVVQGEPERRDPDRLVWSLDVRPA